MQREPSHKPVKRITDQLEIPSLDDRKYRVIQLPNQLEALLVHDPETDKASAALDVNVGAFSDPEDMPGTAHAVEHLLFMGTKKFPTENDYNVYLSSHSGSSNAYTGACSTNYFFDIAAKPSNGEEASATNLSPLHGGLDRFAQFFIEPLFLESTVDRELRAVDSENKKNLQSDQWRLHQLEKSQANPKHPYCHFSTGNFEVLKTRPEADGVDVRQKFIEFHGKHYSANRMKLCVLGREPLDVLESWVTDLFSDVPNKDLPQNRWEDEAPYNKEQLAMQNFAKPVMDSRELNLFFPFLDEEHLFKTQPNRYISHLVGHEGPGSIMAYVKSKGWANSLSAGAYNVCPGTPGMFDCQVRLTKEGLKNYKEVVKVFFQYISLLRQTQPQEWVFEEQKGMADVDFKFKQKTPASRFTSKICAVMQKPLPREWLLSGQSRLREFDPKLIQKGVDLLRPDNMRMTIVSQDFPGGWDQKEKWYGTEYKSEPIPQDFLNELTNAMNCTAEERLSALHLPHQNQFIPTKLEVEKKEVESPSLAPKVIRNDAIARTWYKKDDTFWVPKANLIVSIKNPIIFASAENTVKSKLFTDLVRDALEEYSYDAELAGLQYNVSLDSRGLFIEVSGYNDKLPVLLEQVLMTMRDLSVKGDRFEIIKERLTRGYKNCEYQQPFTQIGDYVSWLTSEHDHVVEQLVAELPAITADALRHFHLQIMSQLHIEAYVHGNIYKEEALKLTDMIESILKPRVLPKEEWPIIRSLEFPQGSNFLYQKILKDPANVNHCIEYYLHIGDKGDRGIRAKTQLLDQILHEPAFDQLRTKEQLGYVVFSGLRGSATTYGFRFIIQSERRSEYLESRIDSFLAAQATAIEKMSDAEFESHKRSVINKRLEKLKNLDQETGRHWAQVSNEYYDFEAAQLDAAQVKMLTKSEMVDYYSSLVHPASPKRAKLVVQLIAQSVSDKTKDAEAANHEEAAPPSNGTNPTKITSVRDFKARLAATSGARPIQDLTTEVHCRRDLPLHFICAQQLAGKTSSSKKRKIATRQSTARHSNDTPIESCEQDDCPTFSFTTDSAPDPPADPAYLRADSLPPASSLPPRLQTNSTSYNPYAEDGSSAASSPSGAYADLSINSDRGGDTPAPEPAASPNTGRGSSPFTKTTHHRAVMGGASDFPERASSPLKRRASSMDPQTADQDAGEDVDMITVPQTDKMDTLSRSTPPSQPNRGQAASEPQASDQTKMDSEEATGSDTIRAPEPPASLEEHVQAIKSSVEEFNRMPVQEKDECFLVSRKWLDNVPDGTSGKQAVGDLREIPPVDNSDIVFEIIKDPCVGDGVADPLMKKFVRLKPGYGAPEQFELFPPKAWKLLEQWPGLKEGQLPIKRTAHDSSANKDGSNIMFELHPLVLSIHRLWSAHSLVPVEASTRANEPAPPRLVRSRSQKFATFLKQTKMVAGLNFTDRIRLWMVPNRPETSGSNASVPTPPASPGHAQTTKDPWTKMLMEVDVFNALERDVERIMVDFSDITNARESSQTLGSLDVLADQHIVIDPKEEGTEWTSSFTVSHASRPLPTRNSSANLSVQNRNGRSGRTSPIPQGPTTRGRANKSGRTPGCVGLGNLGNTCYMNAALQCLRSVEELTKYFLAGEWEHELNKNNPLAHNGDVAAAYAQLLKEIYKDSVPSSVAPRQFKNTVGRYAAGFSGYGQQDSQEFLGFLLDGLQEDLSRVKKKPYIEKPDSTDDMVNDPEAIKRMADQVWDITRKRDDSVIADLFTGLYKSTLVCPTCGKISITFDPFNNLTLQLPIANKWNHTITFFPLNDKPVSLRVELDKHDSLKALKTFVSVRTGIPLERLHGAEEWNHKFYKHYEDQSDISEEITGKDNAWVFEIEAKPTNFPGKPQKRQKLGVGVRSMIDEAENENESSSWDTEETKNLLVPVLHRKPDTRKNAYNSSKRWTWCVTPHFIVVTPQEARSEDAIRRKILEKVATFTTHPSFARQDESDGSESTEPEMIGPNGSDTGSSVGGKVVAQSIKGEDDIVDIQMKDAGADAKDTTQSSKKYQFNRRRPAWVDPSSFLPGDLQNIFETSYFTDVSGVLPTGMNGAAEDREFPKLSSRAAPDSASEDNDNATNGTASNDDSSSEAEDASRKSADLAPTRMNEESDDEDESPPKKQQMKGKSGKKKARQQQRLAQQQQNAEMEESFVDPAESTPDGGPLIRLREGIICDWSTESYDEVFGQNESLSTLSELDTLPDPDLDKVQAVRAKRRKNGITLDECLDEFERDEVLSENDMWYCPSCKEHRRASKKLDLWKTPDILIMHLKRFSSSGWRRDKLETLVDFPVENLDITSRVLQREDGKQEVYDLIGVDCHFGGLGGGHYTAFAKNFVDDQWYSFNDSSVSKTSPERIVDTSAYLLFYRRRSDAPLGGARFRQILDKFVSNDASEDDTLESGEGQRLGEGFSPNGSSSAYQGAEATLQLGNLGGVQQSIEDDEGIDMTDDAPRTSGFHPVNGTNSWSFESITGGGVLGEGDSPGAASDEAQPDSSGDERIMSPIDPELGNHFPGMSQYQLHQSDEDPPSYSELPTQINHNDLKHEVHEVLPDGDDEQRDEDAAEIHLDDDDKIKAV
ncbi:hypothetical protein F5Y15DRAFT_407897 [Xylariaceae sp. FL0016]|nr:hypothetical protein F5Y15DRAFT_407897 [Xylariaceae sp. FL0016]